MIWRWILAKYFFHMLYKNNFAKFGAFIQSFRILPKIGANLPHWGLKVIYFFLVHTGSGSGLRPITETQPTTETTESQPPPGSTGPPSPPGTTGPPSPPGTTGPPSPPSTSIFFPYGQENEDTSAARLLFFEAFGPVNMDTPVVVFHNTESSFYVSAYIMVHAC